VNINICGFDCEQHVLYKALNPYVHSYVQFKVDMVNWWICTTRKSNELYTCTVFYVLQSKLNFA